MNNIFLKTEDHSCQYPPMDNSGRRSRWSIVGLIFACWLLSLASLHPAGRMGPLALGGMDWIAITKVITRIVTTVILGLILLMSRDKIPKRETMLRFLPFSIFAFWAIISSFWSPLKAVSIGHGGELFMLIMLASVAGISCAKNTSESIIFCNISIIMLLYCFVGIFLSYPIIPSITGIYDERPWGITSPNLLAAVAAAGIISLTSFNLLWRWNWARILLVPGLIIHGWALFVTQSRTSILATLVILWVIIWKTRKRGLIPLVVIIAVVTSTILLITDLGDQVSNSVSKYMMRNQTKEEIMSGTGRQEMWRIALQSFQQSPLYGNGYYVMSPRGLEDIWGEYRYHLPHNVFLLVLTGTGVIGGILLTWALCRILWLSWSSLHTAGEKRKIGFLAILFISWSLMVGMFEISFLGPVNPMIVLFFVTIGVAVGKL